MWNDLLLWLWTCIWCLWCLQYSICSISFISFLRSQKGNHKNHKICLRLFFYVTDMIECMHTIFISLEMLFSFYLEWNFSLEWMALKSFLAPNWKESVGCHQSRRKYHFTFLAISVRMGAGTQVKFNNYFEEIDSI